VSANDPGGPALVVAEPLDAIRPAPGRQYFAPNCEGSHYERGERRTPARAGAERRRVRDHESGRWQTHVQVWPRADGSVRLRPHHEFEPPEDDQDHIDGVWLDVAAGVERVAAAVDADGVGYGHHEGLPPGGRRGAPSHDHQHGHRDGAGATHVAP
jgi:hypothetical protein